MYKLIKNPFNGKEDTVTKTEGDITLCIPFAPDNTDYQAYLAWLEQGGIPLPAENT